MESLYSAPTVAESLPLICLCIAGGVSLLFFLTQILPSRNKAPIVNPRRGPLEWSWSRSRQEFMWGSREMIKKGFEMTSGKPFQMYTNNGMMTVLGPEFINEIRNDTRFSFSKHVHAAFFGYLPGFEAFDNSGNQSAMLTMIAQKHLTAQLNSMTKPLSDQCAADMKKFLTESPDWHAISPTREISNIVTRMSSRIFLGRKFVDDDVWIESSGTYGTTAFSAHEQLSMWPDSLAWIVHWVLPCCRELRRNSMKCRKILTRTLAERKRLEKSPGGGESPAQFEDTLSWLDRVAKGKRHDPTKVQLSLSMAAIHTTTDMATWLILCLCKNPGAIKPLRDEIIEVLSAQGWKKTALYNLKLLDSAMKESQRLKPNVVATMRRLVTEDVTLSDGTFLPKKTLTVVSNHHMTANENSCSDREKFDIYRYYNMRRTAGKENIAQFTATSPLHMGFSHGKHSCPGRFFAGNEIKVLMCYLLLYYDLRLIEDSPSNSTVAGLAWIPNPFAQVEVRKRNPEIDLEALVVSAEG